MSLPSLTRRIFLSVLLPLSQYSLAADTADLQRQTALLNLITDTAAKLCTEIPLKGSTTESEVSGKVSAEVTGLAKKFADAGFQVQGGHQNHDFQGLLQQDLLEALRDNTSCKLRVWTDLKDRFLPNASAKVAVPHRQPGDFEPARYVNAGVAKSAGKLNVAISVAGLSDADDFPLEAAIGRALDSRGYQVIPVFRTEFRRAGLSQQLFEGDPSLAARLRLPRYCDAVLLGVLRFVGPAQQAADKLYIREVVLDIRVIDPLSGTIERTLEIDEKGGGATEQLSTGNALDRLKNLVEDRVREWSWT